MYSLSKFCQYSVSEAESSKQCCVLVSCRCYVCMCSCLVLSILYNRSRHKLTRGAETVMSSSALQFHRRMTIRGPPGLRRVFCNPESKFPGLSDFASLNLAYIEKMFRKILTAVLSVLNDGIKDIRRMTACIISRH